MASLNRNIKTLRAWIARLEHYDEIRNSKYDAAKWHATITEAKKRLKIHEAVKRQALARPTTGDKNLT
jgi:hypothetical protein